MDDFITMNRDIQIDEIKISRLVYEQMISKLATFELLKKAIIRDIKSGCLSYNNEYLTFTLDESLKSFVRVIFDKEINEKFIELKEKKENVKE